MTIQTRPTRRHFLQTAGVVTGTMAAPLYIPSTVFGANERIVTAHVGTGERGRIPAARGAGCRDLRR
jgi:hypothetical protein